VQPLVAHRHLAQQHQSLIVHALRDLGLVEAEFGQQPEAGEVRKGCEALSWTNDLLLHINDTMHFEVMKFLMTSKFIA
jgi:hypothetical protein